MESVLLEASMSGNIETLKTLIHNEQFILDRVLATSDENPLHIAALRGHLDFVRTLLIHKRELVNALDTFRRSPLHLASGGGYSEIVRELIKINPEICHFRDQDGKIPLHFAALHEHVDVMNILIQAKPELVREIFDNGETLLHFCVKHNRVEALKVLAKWLEDIGDRDFVNSKDKSGNTILHWAVILKQMQTIKYLLSGGGISGNALNGNGITALDVLELYPIDLDIMKIREILKEAGIQRAKDLIGTSPPSSSVILSVSTAEESSISKSRSSKAKPLILKIWKDYIKSEDKWFEEARGNLMVAATVIASMAFQAGLNPPGGLWQESNEKENAVAGYSIAATRLPGHYNYFLKSNTTSLVASLSTILLIVGGFSLKNRLTTWLLMMTSCLTIVFLIRTYLKSLYIITATNETLDATIKVTKTVLNVMIGLCASVIVLQSLRFLVWIVKTLRKFFLTKTCYWMRPRPKDIL